MWNLDNFLKQKFEKCGFTIDDAWNNGLFEELSELRYKDMNGFQTFYSQKPEEIYTFMKEIGVTKFIPWSDIFMNEKWVMFHGFNFKLKARKKRKGNIPQSQRDKIDTEHKKIKGQKSQNWF